MGIVAALGVNVCFFAGPAIESYGTYFRIWHPVFSWLLFLAGLAVTLCVALAGVLAFANF